MFLMGHEVECFSRLFWYLKPFSVMPEDITMWNNFQIFDYETLVDTIYKQNKEFVIAGEVTLVEDAKILGTAYQIQNL
jgi:hypothetical protein